MFSVSACGIRYPTDVKQRLINLRVLQALLNLVYSFTTQHFGEQHGPSNEVWSGLLQRQRVCID